MKIVLSLFQSGFTLSKPDVNFERVANAAREAAKRGSDILLLPELWASGYDLPNCKEYASGVDSGDFERLRRLAKQYKLMIGGSLLEAAKGKVFNTFVLFDKAGEPVASYRKIHLFSLLRENDYLAAGNRIVLADTPFGKLGMTICYDLRFPELYRLLALQGAEIIFNVAEWPERRINHWDILLKTRAIENQVFIAAVNKVGESSGARLGGHSVILDPWGREVVFGSTHEVLLTAGIDTGEIQRARKWIPVLRDRRDDVYGFARKT